MFHRRIPKVLLALLMVILTWGFASPAGAVDNPDYTVEPPSSVVVTRQPARTVSTAVQVNQTRTQLPITGSDVSTLVVVGLALVGAGAVVLLVRRKAPAPA